MSNKPHLNFYKAYLTHGMPQMGLCNCAVYKYIDAQLLDNFTPSFEEREALEAAELSRSFWGYEVKDNSPEYRQLDKYYKLTPLRQTIVLLMAAMNNEL